MRKNGIKPFNGKKTTFCLELILLFSYFQVNLNFPLEKCDLFMGGTI